MVEHYFVLADYFVFASVLIVSVAVGIFYAVRDRRQLKSNNNSSFLTGDRQLPLIPVALSLLVSFQSAILILGASSEVYLRGTTYWWSVVGIGLSALLTCYIFVPIFYYLKLTSIYEYLELRFNSRALRLIGSSLYVLVTSLYMSLAIYAPSVALSAVTEFPLWLLILISGLVCTFYVTLGGIKAIIWTDAIQAGFMLAGLLAVAIKGTLEVGGFSNVIQLSRDGGRLIYFEPSGDPFIYMSTWGVVFGQLFSWLGWYGINQSSVQRYCGMRTPSHGRYALLLNIPGLFIAVTLVCYCGLVMYVKFVACDPLASKTINYSDELMPYFVMQVLKNMPGVPGLFLACLYSGTLSTVSSGLNSMAAVVWEDFIKTNISNVNINATYYAKGLCLFFGVFSTTFAFLGPYLGGILQACVSALGAVNGPLTGLFLLGVFMPWVNKKGAILGALVSTGVCIWLCIGAQILKPHSSSLPTKVDGCENVGDLSMLFSINSSVSISALPESSAIENEGFGFSKFYSLSYVLYDMLGVFLVVLVALPVSYFTGFQDFQKLDKKMFHPLIQRFFINRKETDKLCQLDEQQQNGCTEMVESATTQTLLKPCDDNNV